MIFPHFSSELDVSKKLKLRLSNLCNSEVDVFTESELGIHGIPVRPTKLTRLVRLYNLASDPEEKIDISDDYPELVESLLSKLSQYNQTMVEPNYPPVDPLSFPDLQGDFFKPWFG